MLGSLFSTVLTKDLPKEPVPPVIKIPTDSSIARLRDLIVKAESLDQKSGSGTGPSEKL
jgi:hypothetical protein